MIEVTKEEYVRMRKAEITLNALYAGGVDNWEWFGESLPREEELKEVEMEVNAKD